MIQTNIADETFFLHIYVRNIFQTKIEKYKSHDKDHEILQLIFLVDNIT